MPEPIDLHELRELLARFFGLTLEDVDHLTLSQIAALVQYAAHQN